MVTGDVGGWHDDKYKLPMKNEEKMVTGDVGGWHDDKCELPMKTKKK